MQRGRAAAERALEGGLRFRRAECSASPAACLCTRPPGGQRRRRCLVRALAALLCPCTAPATVAGWLAACDAGGHLLPGAAGRLPALLPAHVLHQAQPGGRRVVWASPCAQPAGACGRALGLRVRWARAGIGAPAGACPGTPFSDPAPLRRRAPRSCARWITSTRANSSEQGPAVMPEWHVARLAAPRRAAAACP